MRGNKKLHIQLNCKITKNIWIKEEERKHDNTRNYPFPPLKFEEITLKDHL